MLTATKQRILLDTSVDRSTFVRKLSLIGGAPTALWLPYGGDLLTNTSWPDTRVWTHANTQTGRWTRLGYGGLVSFNGTSDRLTGVDATDLSPGDGSTDSAFSVVVMGNVTDTAAYRSLITKSTLTGPLREWLFDITNTDTLSLTLFDQSASTPGASPSAISTAAVTQGSVTLLGATYTAATGGATAANDITLYEKGAVKASSASNEVAYVAMENTTAGVTIGDFAGATQWFSGSMGFAAFWKGTALTAAQHKAIASLCREYFGVTL